MLKREGKRQARINAKLQTKNKKVMKNLDKLSGDEKFGDTLGKNNDGTKTEKSEQDEDQKPIVASQA